jgi:hypothetical protein
MLCACGLVVGAHTAWAQDVREDAPPATPASSVDPFAPTLRFESGPVIDVVPGGMAVIIVDPAWKLQISKEPSARLDDGRILPVVHRRIVVRQSAHPPEWIADPGEWSTQEMRAPLPEEGRDVFTAEALAMELPLDAIGQGVWVDGQRLGLNWLISPAILSSLSQTQGFTWPPGLTVEQRQDQRLLSMLAPLSRSPMTRWRYRLLIDGLVPVAADQHEGVQFADPILEALADQQEVSWQHGLSKIKEAGPVAPEQDAATLVTHALTQLVALDHSDGTVWLPCWLDDPSLLNQLLTDLVAPNLRPKDASTRARAFADVSPRLVAWIADDAAVLHPATSAPMPLAGVLNLSERAITLSAQISDRSGRGTSPGSDLRIFAANQGGWIGDLAPSPGLDLTAGPTLNLESGVSKARLPIQSAPVRVSPPGLVIAPFFAPWRQADLLRETPQPRLQPGLTATLSYRSSSRGDDTPDSPSGWVLLVERRGKPGDVPADAESIRVVWGPRQAEAHIDVRRIAADTTSAQRSFIDASGNWYVEIVLPNSVLDRDGLAQLGVAWSSGDGARASWPRAMLPMDDSPGRVLLNLGSW